MIVKWWYPFNKKLMSEEIYIFLNQQSWKIKHQGQRSMNFSGKIEQLLKDSHFHNESSFNQQIAMTFSEMNVQIFL